MDASFSKAAGNPQEVADAVLRIIETPTGQRQLRYRIARAGLGVEEINAVCEQVQRRMLDAFGFSADVMFPQQRPAKA